MRGQRPLPPDETSVLDAVGGEIVAIVSPVSICMMCCVFLVRLLRVDGEDATQNVRGGIASAAYQEESSDSTAVRAGGAVLNSVVFVLFITCATFGIFFLFKHNCTRLIWGYMGLSGLLIFGVLGPLIAMEVLQAIELPIDILTFAFCAYNFAIVGVLVTFFWPGPLLMKQAYLVAVAVVVAFYFTRIPEWTTWTLLVAMAIYDLYAVLTPSGPLRVLVELAQERDEQIPALVYEARPVERPRSDQEFIQTRAAALGRGTAGGGILEAMMAAPRVPGAFAERLGGGSGNGSGSSSYGAADDGAGNDPSETLVSESRPLIDAAAGEGSLGSLGSRGSGPGPRGGDDAVPGPAGPAGLGPEGEPFRLPDAVKLGLGDFIFYSVLVSRAAMYDVFAMLACYFAIIQGLIFTLLLLGLAQKALPALPISIALGVVTYVGTRYAFEPVTQQLLQKGLYF